MGDVDRRSFYDAILSCTLNLVVVSRKRSKCSALVLMEGLCSRPARGWEVSPVCPFPTSPSKTQNLSHALLSKVGHEQTLPPPMDKLGVAA